MYDCDLLCPCRTDCRPCTRERRIPRPRTDVKSPAIRAAIFAHDRAVKIRDVAKAEKIYKTVFLAHV